VPQAKHLALAFAAGMLSSGSQGCHYTEKQRLRSLQPYTTIMVVGLASNNGVASSVSFLACDTYPHGSTCVYLYGGWRCQQKQCAGVLPAAVRSNI